MIKTLEGLHEHLQWALELEHSTIPPYLCALYSIKPKSNIEAFEVIHSIFIEEMLHMALVANIAIATGCNLKLDYPEFMPNYPSPTYTKYPSPQNPADESKTKTKQNPALR